MIFVIAFILFAVLHSLLASRSFKKRVISAYPVMRFYYRFLYNLVALFTFAIVWFAAPVSTAEIYTVPSPLSYVMHLVQIGALTGLYYSVKVAGTGNFTGLNQLRHASQDKHPSYDLDEPKDEGFVVQGPFRYVRHPLYVFSMIVLILHPYMTIKWLLLTILAGAYFIIGSKFEEQRLIDRFGEKYNEYKKDVPAFIPGSVIES